jgi:bacterial/archaeal transporter family protein
MPSSSDWLMWALLSALFTALTAIFAKVGLKDVAPDFAAVIRTAIILVTVAVFVWTTGKWQDPFGLSGKAWLFLALSGLSTAAAWVCYFRALKAGEASKVEPIDKTSVVLVAIFAAAFLGERPAPLGWLGIGLVAVGVVVLGLKP